MKRNIISRLIYLILLSTSTNLLFYRIEKDETKYILKLSTFKYIFTIILIKYIF